MDEVVSALGGLDVLGGGVTLLGLAVAAGEEDEALPVLLEALRRVLCSWKDRAYPSAQRERNHGRDGHGGCT